MHRNHIASVLALCLVTAIAPIGAAQDAAAPLLVEVQPDPTADGPEGEWVELVNPTAVPLSLDGFYLTDRDPCFVPGKGFVREYAWPLSGEIAPGEHRVIVLPAGCVNLANSGDDLALLTEGDTEIQTIRYGAGTPLGTPEDGESLSACSGPSQIHLGWSRAPESPGSANPSCLG